MGAQIAVHGAERGRSGQAARLAGCRAEVSSELLDEQGQLLDRLIDFAFDVLGACYLDVRVVPGGTAAGSSAAQPPEATM